jgi:hypothetical protein
MHYGVSVANTSKKIVPMPALMGAPDWKSGTTYAIGDYVRSNGRYYMATAAGVAGATAPTGYGAAVSDGTVTWLSCLPHARKGIVIVNEGSTSLYVSMIRTAVANAGVLLVASGGALTLSGDSTEQCECHAIRPDATAGNVSILEW